MTGVENVGKIPHLKKVFHLEILKAFMKLQISNLKH